MKGRYDYEELFFWFAIWFVLTIIPVTIGLLAPDVEPYLLSILFLLAVAFAAITPCKPACGALMTKISIVLTIGGCAMVITSPGTYALFVLCWGLSVLFYSALPDAMETRPTA